MLYRAKTYCIAFIAFISAVSLPLSAQAQLMLQITDISVTDITDTRAIVHWTTNVPATARIDFGLDTSYGTYLTIGSEQFYDHEIMLTNLTPLSTYHFDVTSTVGSQSVTTFDRTFQTTAYVDTTIPEISNVHVAYVTATQATFQWETNEIANSIVKFGKTSVYTAQAGNGYMAKIHDVTVGGLAPGTSYHFQVASSDPGNNTAFGNDMNIITLSNTEPEKVPLTISNVRPLTINDTQLGTNEVTISWDTNKLSTGVIRLGTTTWLGQNVTQSSSFRTFQHSALISELQPDTLYYFDLISYDVFGAGIVSDMYTFKTKKIPVVSVTTPQAPEQVLVLGFSTLDTTSATALYKIQGTSDIYAILDGQRYRMTGPKSLAEYAHQLPVKDSTQATLENYPLVHLVKASDGNTVYYLYRRANNRILKLAIPSPAVFASYGANRWSDIVSLDPTELAQYPNVSLVHVPGDTTVYLITGGVKHAFSSQSAFQNRGYVSSDVVDISRIHLNYYTTGATLQ